MNKDSHLHVYRTFTNLLRNVLMDFQYIEEALRWNISLSYKIANKKIDKTIPFNYSDTDFERDAMGALISKYEKYCNDVDLIKALRDLTKHRNGAAHKGWLMNAAQRDDKEYLKTRIDELEDIADKSKSAFHKLTAICEELDDINNSLPNK